MSLAIFLEQLFDSGRVTVGEQLASDPMPPAELDGILRRLDEQYRRQLPAGWPPLDMPWARYGAVTLYRACQLLVFRKYDAAAVEGAIAWPPPRPNPAEHASVDLVLHFLPDVIRLARAAAPEDVLVKRLLGLAQRWPLSSVGIADIGPVDALPLAADKVVWRLYIDRILVAGDRSRLGDERVREAVRESVGAFPELAGELSGELSNLS